MTTFLKEKLKTTIWFLKQPKYWKQYISLVKRKFYGDDQKQKKEALGYCKSLSIPLKKYLVKTKIEHLHFNLIEHKLYRIALAKQKESKHLLGGGANLDLLYSIASLPHINNILETGVAYGWSSLAILAGLNKNKRGNLISIDMPYPKMGNEETVGIVVPDQLKSNWTLIREADVTGIEKGLKKHQGEIDMCHYDSDKSYQGRKWAYPILWQALVSGGYFISDDIQDNMGFKEFCDSVNVNPTIINYDGKYLGILIKP